MKDTTFDLDKELSSRDLLYPMETTVYAQGVVYLKIAEGVFSPHYEMGSMWGSGCVSSI